MELWKTLDEILNNKKSRIENLSIIEEYEIPSEEDLKLEVGRWYRIRNVVSLYADLEGSTKLTNDNNIKEAAKIHEIFTGSLISILKIKEFKASYIDIKGDGGFALWKEKYGPIKALLAGVTFKTMINYVINDYLKTLGIYNELKVKIGIHIGTVLVKKVGERDTGDMKYNWAVWVGEPVNYSAKLSDLTLGDTILVTQEVYNNYKQPDFNDWLNLSCGCQNGKYTGKKDDLWSKQEVTLGDNKIEAYVLKANWCKKHGEDYLNIVLDKINSN